MGQIKHDPHWPHVLYERQRWTCPLPSSTGLLQSLGMALGPRKGCELLLGRWYPVPRAAAGLQCLPPCLALGPGLKEEKPDSSVSVTLAASFSETASAKPLPAAVRLRRPPWRAEEACCPQERSALLLPRKACEEGRAGCQCCHGFSTWPSVASPHSLHPAARSPSSPPDLLRVSALSHCLEPHSFLGC